MKSQKVIREKLPSTTLHQISGKIEGIIFQSKLYECACRLCKARSADYFESSVVAFKTIKNAHLRDSLTIKVKIYLRLYFINKHKSPIHRVVQRARGTI